MPFDATPVDSEVVTVLRKARALIDSPKKWLNRAAMDGPRLCMMGALVKVDEENFSSPYIQAWELLTKICGDIPAWNDSHAHSDVMEAFDKAIILAGGTP